MGEILDAKRRELESKDRVKSFCAVHGQHDNEVCPKCYDAQAIRVEKESDELRINNTTESLRNRVVEILAGQNGG